MRKEGSLYKFHSKYHMSVLASASYPKKIKTEQKHNK